MKQLKTAGLSSNQLLHYYSAVIRQVLEYYVSVWHYALTKAQTEQLEALQKRVIHIILNFTRSMPYMSMLSAANLSVAELAVEMISRVKRKLFVGVLVFIIL